MYKTRIRFEKQGCASYISHLDLMRALQRSLTRAALPVRYTAGFNPHIYLSILAPLSTGYQSEYELADFDLTCDYLPADLTERLNAVLPQGLRVLAAGPAARPVGQIASCDYLVSYHSPWNEKIPEIFQGQVKIIKRSTRGDKEAVLNDYIRRMEFEPADAADPGQGFCCRCRLKAGEDPMNPSYITDVLRFHNLVSQEDRPLYFRKAILDEGGNLFF